MGLLGDFFRYEERKIDEERVIRDEINRDRDLMEGDFLGAAVEEVKLGYDKRNLREDFISEDMYRDPLYRRDNSFRDERLLETEILEDEMLFNNRLIEDEILTDVSEDIIDDFERF